MFGCKTGYDSQANVNGEKIPVHGFPKNQNDRHMWLHSLPNKLSIEQVTENMGVCSHHWPPDTPKERRGRWMVPIVPPSIFPNVPNSCVPTPFPTTPRPTKNLSVKPGIQTLTKWNNLGKWTD